MYVYIYVCIHTHTHIYLSIYIDVCMHIYIYIYTHTHTHIGAVGWGRTYRYAAASDPAAHNAQEVDVPAHARYGIYLIYT